MKKILINILIILLLSGCSCLEDKRVAVKPDKTSPEYKQIAKLLINNWYNNEYLRQIAFERAMAEYKLSLE